MKQYRIKKFVSLKIVELLTKTRFIFIKRNRVLLTLVSPGGDKSFKPKGADLNRTFPYLHGRSLAVPVNTKKHANSI